MADKDDAVAALKQLQTRIQSNWTSVNWDKNQPLINIVGWNAPVLSGADFSDRAGWILERIERLKSNELTKAMSEFLQRVAQRVNAISLANLGSDPDSVVGSANDVLSWVEGNLPPLSTQLDWEAVKDSELPRDLKRRLRSVAAQLAEMEPKAGDLTGKIADIEAAHAAAEQLPTDMQELSVQRERLTVIADTIAKDAITVEANKEKVAKALEAIAAQEDQARKLIAQCEEAYRITTSKGLAGAFETRAGKLTFASWMWVIGLAAALGCAFWVGFDRYSQLKEVLKPGVSATIIWANALMAILGVGAPIWFAWLSTKQIGQNFRLAEDYAFKASVAKAYEGYRREAAHLDPALEQRLFGSALTRLEEAPIRLVDAHTHSSPLQELLSSPALRAAFDSIPDMKDKILALIPGKGDVAAAVVAPLAAATAVATNTARAEEQPHEE